MSDKKKRRDNHKLISFLFLVKNGIFCTDELNFLFRSTLEFTRLDKAKVKAIIQELKEDLDLTKSSTRSQTRSSKYVVAPRRVKK